MLATATPVAGVPPKLTVAPAGKFVPVIVSGVPPLVGPMPGVTAVTAGAGIGVYRAGSRHAALAGLIAVCAAYTTLFAVQYRLDLVPKVDTLTVSE